MASLYEGRTRGKRLRYTFSDEEDDGSGSADTNRRSTRNSGAVTPADPSRPTITASGRQVRSRLGGIYGESLLSGPASTGGASPATENYEHSDASDPGVAGRPTRSSRRGNSNGRSKPRKHIEGYNSVDELDDEDEATSSGHDWDGGDEDEIDDNLDEDEDDEMSVDSEEEDFEPKSLVITLRYRKGATPQKPSNELAPLSVRNSQPPPVAEVPDAEPEVPVPPTAVAPSVANGLPTQYVSTEAPNGYSALVATGRPTTALAQIRDGSLKHASDQPLAAPPGMLAVHPVSAAPVATAPVPVPSVQAAPFSAAPVAAHQPPPVQPVQQFPVQTQAPVPHPQLPGQVEAPIHKPQPYPGQVSSVSGAYL
jgi:hypothetical protein